MAHPRLIFAPEVEALYSELVAVGVRSPSAIEIATGIPRGVAGRRLRALPPMEPPPAASLVTTAILEAETIDAACAIVADAASILRRVRGPS